MADQRAELITNIHNAIGELRSTLDSVTNQELDAATPNEAWTARDCLAHLATIEARQRMQLHCALDGAEWTDTEDIDSYNARMVAARKGWSAAQLRTEVESEHAATLAIIEGLKPGDLEKAFDHPRRGRMNVEQILASIPTHLRSHLADVTAVQGK